MSKEIRIAVVGSPGHGKSTFLNGLLSELAKKEEDKNPEHFKMSCDGQGSCTKDVTQHTFEINAWQKKACMEAIDGSQGVEGCIDGSKMEVVKSEEETLRLTVFDTMGFPDPEPRKAADFYDQVVSKAVNNKGGLNALVWILNHDRPDMEAINRSKVLMTQIATCRCKFIVVVNGKQNYEAGKFRLNAQQKKDAAKVAERDKAVDEAKAWDRKNMFDSCKIYMEEIGVTTDFEGEPRTILVLPSTNQEEFELVIPHHLVAAIINTECVTSDVMTFGTMQKAFASVESAKAKMEELAAAARQIREKAQKEAVQRQEKIQEQMEKLQKEAIQKEIEAADAKTKAATALIEKAEKAEAAKNAKRLAEIAQEQKNTTDAQKAAADAEQASANAEISSVQSKIDMHNRNIAGYTRDKDQIAEDFKRELEKMQGSIVGWFKIALSHAGIVNLREGRDRQLEGKNALIRSEENYLATEKAQLKAIKTKNPALAKKIEAIQRAQEDQEERIAEANNIRDLLLKDVDAKENERAEEERKAAEAETARKKAEKQREVEEQNLRERTDSFNKKDQTYAKKEQEAEDEADSYRHAANEKKKQVDAFLKYLA